MKCPRCNSENVQMQSKISKAKLTLPICLVCGGLGLIFLSVIGLIVGVLVGLLISVIIKSLLPTGYVSVMVCQDCGYVAKPSSQRIAKSDGHPLFSTAENSNLVIVRDNSQVGSAVQLDVLIDGYAPFSIGNDMIVNLLLPDGQHHISYRQASGLGKQNRSGTKDITVSDEKQTVHFVFTAKGIEVR